ncbi:MAG: hypothetical protein HGA38_01675 [Candidatus Moranbacteria bacterium]|nr:hypothetical protein [Candidatus Moranbacteria bacterium]
MIRRALFILAIGTLTVFLWAYANLIPEKRVFYSVERVSTFPFQSVDTMKYSRDLAREKAGDITFDAIIERQVAAIAESGATHVAVATPYDEEFAPMLARWISSARRHGIKVWFRGNLSGWEGWFGYRKITRAQHLSGIVSFINSHPEFFEDGDAFSTCPECENGGPGDPRQTGDVAGFRQFLVSEHDAARDAFRKMGKDVRTDLFSMNGDVARLVMDRPTTKALGGTVTIDHYVKTPEWLVADAEAIAKQSGGTVVFGEFGAPIPDIHGEMTEEQQAKWLESAMRLLSGSSAVSGANYWSAVGSSTQLWDSEGNPSKAAKVLRQYYRPRIAQGIVSDELGRVLSGVSVTSSSGATAVTDTHGHYSFGVPGTETATVRFSLDGYDSREVAFTGDAPETDVILRPIYPNPRYRLLRLFGRFFGFLHMAQ